MKILFLPLVCLLVITQNGCVSDTVTYANSSPKDLDMTREKKITGKAGGLYLFDFFPIYMNSRQKSAYEDMMMKVGSNYHVVDVLIKDQWKWVFIGTKCNTYVTGLAYPIRPERAPTSPVVIPSQPQIDPIAEKLGNLKRMHKDGQLTDTEYEAARRKVLGL
jgi:hypothetical protein